jgi:hypothetical protein
LKAIDLLSVALKAIAIKPNALLSIDLKATIAF